MSLYKKIKKRVFEIIGPSKNGDKPSMIFDIVICTLIVLSAISVILELSGVASNIEHELLILNM